MSKSSKSNVRKKSTKNIEKQRTIEIMKANINPVTNNPNLHSMERGVIFSTIPNHNPFYVLFRF